MKYRVEFVRKDSATRACEAGRKFAVELVAKNEAEARELATRDAARIGKAAMFNIEIVRKI